MKNLNLTDVKFVKGMESLDKQEFNIAKDLLVNTFVWCANGEDRANDIVRENLNRVLPLVKVGHDIDGALCVHGIFKIDSTKLVDIYARENKSLGDDTYYACNINNSEDREYISKNGLVGYISRENDPDTGIISISENNQDILIVLTAI